MHCRLLSSTFIVLSLASSAQATPRLCDTQSVSYVYDTYDTTHRWTGSHDFELMLNLKTCEVAHVWTPHLACELRIGTSHGSASLDCGPSFRPQRRIRSADDPRSYFDTVGDGTKAIVPSSKALRQTYAHLDDDDSAKPFSKGQFPRAFVTIAKAVRVDNPDFLTSRQTLTYRTMMGETMIGISGDAERGCVKYQFGIVIDPTRMSDKGAVAVDMAEHDMASFLGDMRLEPVPDPAARLRELPPPHFGDRVVQPIMACVRS